MDANNKKYYENQEKKSETMITLIGCLFVFAAATTVILGIINLMSE